MNLLAAFQRRAPAIDEAAAALAREGARQREAARKALVYSKARAMRVAYGLPAAPALESGK